MTHSNPSTAHNEPSNGTSTIMKTITLTGALLLILLSACSDSPVQSEGTQVPDRIVLQAPVTSFHSLDQARSIDATVLDRNGNVVPDASLSWTLDGEGVAEMSAPGVFRSVANGEARLTVRVDGTESSVSGPGYSSGVVEQTHQLVVHQRPAGLKFSGTQYVEGEPITVSWLGGALDIEAQVVDANGNPMMRSVPEIQWVVGNPAILQHMEDGRIVPMESGTTSMEARVGRWSTTFPVHVDAHVELDWCASYQVPRPDAPENGVESCSVTGLTFTREDN